MDLLSIEISRELRSWDPCPGSEPSRRGEIKIGRGGPSGSGARWEEAAQDKRALEVMPQTFATARAKARPETIWNACFKNVSEWDKWDPDIKKVS